MNFDPGFAHKFPRKHGVNETLIYDGRVLIADNTAQNKPPIDQSQNSIFFPSVVVEDSVYYSIPRDSRDFTSYLRLLKSPSQAQTAGRLIGEKLLRVRRVYGAMPEDDILERFSVFMDVNNDSQYGVDCKILPPYIGINEIDVDNVLNTTAEDFDQSSSASQLKVHFIGALEQGLIH